MTKEKKKEQIKRELAKRAEREFRERELDAK